MKENKPLLFSNRDLRRIITPLLLEQFLVMLVGLLDTFIITSAGEAAVSGVSLVNAFNTILIYLFTALAAGGTVVISQYIGRKSLGNASEAASQLLLFAVLFSVTLMALVLPTHRLILRLLFGRVEEDVMTACVTYMKITTLSYPAIAIYNAGAAMYRSFGKTSTTLLISGTANVINTLGNVIGVYVLHAGVRGVAYPTLLSYCISAVWVTILCFRTKKNPIRYEWKKILKWNWPLQKRILRIAVPNGLETGFQQAVKVGLSSIIALFGTYQIAANGISQSIWCVSAFIPVAMGVVFSTVIGQCMGADDIPQAEYYFKKLLKITLVICVIWEWTIAALTPLFIRFYNIAPETKRLVVILVLLHNILNAFIFPYSGSLASGLRATGDVTFTLVVAILSTLFGRLLFSILFGLLFQWGILGIACAMVLDWIIRAVAFLLRFRAGKWKSFKVI